MLKLAKSEPAWLEIRPARGDDPAVRVEFAPIGIKAIRAARRAVAEALQIDPEDVEEAGDALSRELIRRGIRAWEGIGDAEGKVVAVTPENVELFLADPAAFEVADRVYVLPWVKRESEGNASAGSPNGTSTEATPALDTVSSPAKRRRRGGARQNLEWDPRVAPTSSTSPRPKRGKRSGRS